MNYAFEFKDDPEHWIIVAETFKKALTKSIKIRGKKQRVKSIYCLGKISENKT